MQFAFLPASENPVLTLWPIVIKWRPLFIIFSSFTWKFLTGKNSNVCAVTVIDHYVFSLVSGCFDGSIEHGSLLKETNWPSSMYNHKSSSSTESEYHPEVICELCMNYDACLLFLHSKLICIKWDKFIIMQLCDSGIGLLCLKSKYWWDLSSCLSLGVLFKSSFCLWAADLQFQEAAGCPLCVTLSMLWEFVSLWLWGLYLFSFAFLRFFPFFSLGLVQTSLIRQAYLEIYPFDELKNALSETLIISLKFCLQSQ